MTLLDFAKTDFRFSAFNKLTEKFKSDTVFKLKDFNPPVELKYITDPQVEETSDGVIIKTHFRLTGNSFSQILKPLVLTLEYFKGEKASAHYVANEKGEELPVEHKVGNDIKFYRIPLSEPIKLTDYCTLTELIWYIDLHRGLQSSFYASLRFTRKTLDLVYTEFSSVDKFEKVLAEAVCKELSKLRCSDAMAERYLWLRDNSLSYPLSFFGGNILELSQYIKPEYSEAGGLQVRVELVTKDKEISSQFEHYFWLLEKQLKTLSKDVIVSKVKKDYKVKYKHFENAYNACYVFTIKPNGEKKPGVNLCLLMKLQDILGKHFNLYTFFVSEEDDEQV